MRRLTPSSFQSASIAITGRRFVAVMVLAASASVSLPTTAGPNNLQSIAEREVLRRQGLVKAAEGQLAEGQLLVEKGQAEEAAKTLLAAYESLPAVPVTEEIRGRLRAAYASAACIWAKSLVDGARYSEASKVLDGVLDPDVDPGNKDALRLRQRMADPDRYPVALTPQHVTNTKEVIRLLALAASHADLGRYNEATSTYQDVLRIDPYNTAARRGMERVEQLRISYQKAARDHTRSKLLGEVDKQWDDAVPTSQNVSSLFGGPNDAVVSAGGRDQLIQKIRTLVVPKVQFTDASLDEVIDYLRVTARNIDPQGRGVDFIVNLEQDARNKKQSLDLANIPLEELIRYVTEKVGAVYKVEPNAVVIGSLTERSTTLTTKTYKVPPDFIQTAAVDTAGAAAGNDPFAKKPAGDTGAGQGLQVRRMGAKEFLEGRGVTFPDGAAATFSGSDSSLIVRNTADNLAIVDLLVDTALASGAKQVVITVKLIDVSETRLNELGFDWELGQFNIPGSNKVFASGGGIGNQGTETAFASAMPGGGSVGSTLMTAGLRSSGAILGKPGIDGLIAASSKSGAVTAPDSRSPAQFALLGVFTDPSFQMALRSLSQAKGVDLVTSPSITVKSGQKSSVREVREFPYPTQFDPPQIPQNFSGAAVTGFTALIGAAGNIIGGSTITGSNSFPITPTTPTAFTTKEVGTVLEVEPVISDDGRTVDLSLTPSDVEFEGFIDYGSPITTPGDSNQSGGSLLGLANNSDPKTVHENHIFQPVFRSTKTTTSVKVYDGSTIMIGGVVSEKKTDINDKVPLIGDIPLVGRFWQSKVTQSEKRCVIFFVTVKVIDPGGNRISQATAPQ